MKKKIALIGPGRVGCAVARRLHQAGFPVTTIISRDLSRAEDACRFIGCTDPCAAISLQAALQAEIILLAVPDDRLATVSTELRAMTAAPIKQLLIHFSGLHPAGIMRVSGEDNPTLSIHPLLPFASRESAVQQLTGCPCALEGDEDQMAIGKTLVSAFSGKPFQIETEKKTYYHAAASIASNFLVSLLDSATELLSGCGIDREQALQLLLPLVRATLDNVSVYGTEQGLTGPIVRGDQSTVAAHLSALREVPAQYELYQLLGRQTLLLAERSTRISAETATRLQQLFPPR